MDEIKQFINMRNNKYDLEKRLICFSVMIIELVEQFPPSFAWKHLGEQLIRSSTSPALNYGEAQAAESKADFIHKMSICYKELRESWVSLQILELKPPVSLQLIKPVLEECNELVAIFTQSLKTARINFKK